MMPVNWLTIRRFPEETGYTENAAGEESARQRLQ